MKRKLKINIANRNHKEGEIINVRVDKKGTPLSSYWRRRLRDADMDNCVEWVPEKKPMKQTSTKKESNS